MKCFSFVKSVKDLYGESLTVSEDEVKACYEASTTRGFANLVESLTKEFQYLNVNVCDGRDLTEIITSVVNNKGVYRFILEVQVELGKDLVVRVCNINLDFHLDGSKVIDALKLITAIHCLRLLDKYIELNVASCGIQLGGKARHLINKVRRTTQANGVGFANGIKVRCSIKRKEEVKLLLKSIARIIKNFLSIQLNTLTRLDKDTLRTKVVGNRITKYVVRKHRFVGLRGQLQIYKKRVEWVLKALEVVNQTLIDPDSYPGLIGLSKSKGNGRAVQSIQSLENVVNYVLASYLDVDGLLRSRLESDDDYVKLVEGLPRDEKELKFCLIDKPDGGKRPLGVPSHLSKFIQRMISPLLNEIVNEEMADAAKGGKHDESRPIYLDIDEGKNKTSIQNAIVPTIRKDKETLWYVNSDISNAFCEFDRIAFTSKAGNRVNKLIKPYFQHYYRIKKAKGLRIEKDNSLSFEKKPGNWLNLPRERGMAQGMVLAPAVFDYAFLMSVVKPFVKRYRFQITKAWMLRDDVVFGCRTKRAAEYIKRKWVEHCLKWSLRVNVDKTKVTDSYESLSVKYRRNRYKEDYVEIETKGLYTANKGNKVVNQLKENSGEIENNLTKACLRFYWNKIYLEYPLKYVYKKGNSSWRINKSKEEAKQVLSTIKVNKSFVICIDETTRNMGLSHGNSFTIPKQMQKLEDDSIALNVYAYFVEMMGDKCFGSNHRRYGLLANLMRVSIIRSLYSNIGGFNSRKNLFQKMVRWLNRLDDENISNENLFNNKRFKTILKEAQISLDWLGSVIRTWSGRFSDVRSKKLTELVGYDEDCCGDIFKYMANMLLGDRIKYFSSAIEAINCIQYHLGSKSQYEMEVLGLSLSNDLIYRGQAPRNLSDLSSESIFTKLIAQEKG